MYCTMGGWMERREQIKLGGGRSDVWDHRVVSEEVGQDHVHCHLSELLDSVGHYYMPLHE